MKKYLIILTLLLAGKAYADVWAPPEIKDYYNSDSTFYVRIYPQQIPDKYYNWVGSSPKKKRKFQPADTIVTPCFARMYRVINEKDSLIWEQKLINRVAPVTAIVSDDGKFLVTFDNWYSTGYGVDVMVFYNEKGELIKRFMLEDISPFPINTYLMTISSLIWRCGQKFIDNQRISVCFRNDEGVTKEITYNLAEFDRSLNTLKINNTIEENVNYVPDEATAIKIAEAIWLPLYGDRVSNEKPYLVSLIDDDVWVVSGTLPQNTRGGVAYIEIRKKDCKVLKVTHGK